MNEWEHLGASLGWWRAILQQTTHGFRLGRQGVLVPEMRRPWASPRSAYHRVPRSPARAGELTGLGKLAFASLWLLVFSIPWEDAITISDFGTSARLVGMVTVGLGFLAIIERGAVRHPTTGHVMLFLFVVLAALSYLWSLYPEGTVVQVFSYLQLFTMVWLIWELSPRARDQMRLLQAYVFGTFVSGVDTIYLFLTHQESVYQRYAGARLDANDLGLMMALSIPVSYYLLIQAQGDGLGLQTTTGFGRDDNFADCLQGSRLGGHCRPHYRALDSCALDRASENRRSLHRIATGLRRSRLCTLDLLGPFIHDAQRTHAGDTYRAYCHLESRLGAFPCASCSGCWSERVPHSREPRFGFTI